MGNKKTNYQNHYQDKLGSASIDIKKAVAGQLTNCKLTYKVGELGIADGGTLKLLLRISSDVPDVQFDSPQKPNFVKISSNKKTLKLVGHSRTNGAMGKIHERPWTNGFTIFAKEADLLEDGKIYIEFSNWRMQTIIEETFEFKFMVDPFATGKYIELKKNPAIEIVAGKPAKLVVVAPTTVSANEKFKALIKIEDQWGNPCMNKNGVFTIKNYEKFGLKNPQAKFKKGKALLMGKMEAIGTTAFMEASYEKMAATSNPITVIDNKSKKQYWGDLHGQTEETVGTNSLEYYMKFAKDYALLDVISSQANGFQIDNDLWDKTKKLSKKYSEKEKFLVLLGYEWSGQTGKGGDRNVIFQNYNEPIYKSSHALVDSYEDIATDCPTANDLFKQLKKHKALTIAHVGGRYANLEMHDNDIEKLLEVHSDWGTFEWFLFDALEKNYKVGIVANSDNHNGRPGASYPGLEEFDCYGGLTCVLAKKLDNKSIFKALQNKHTYATTGAKIYMDAKCVYEINGKKMKAEIGDELPAGSKPEKLVLNCKGTAPIEKIDIFNKSQLLKTFHADISKKSKYLKISWTGTELKGRNRNYNWKGKIIFSGTQIKNVQPVATYNQTKISNTDKKIDLDTFTTGNTQGMIIELSKMSGKCSIELNGDDINIDLDKINNKPMAHKIQGDMAKVEIVQTAKSDKPGDLSLAYTLREDDLVKSNAVFIKITQKDGHMLWTSPFYFS